MNKTIAVHTLGCKTNQYDTQAMLEQFLNAGYSQVDFTKESNVYIINTCSVTTMADKKSRQFIRRAREHKDAIIMVCGCLSQRDSEQMKELGADIVIGTSRRGEALKLLQQYKGESISVVGDVHKTTFEKLNINEFDNTRALIKIQEGCDNFCTYCIIASLRGNPRSRSLEDIQNEAVRLADNGYKEIVLTGTNLATYGSDTGNTLKDAIDAVCKSNIIRVRIGSLDPGIFDDDFIEYLADNNKVCRHFHISLQSGSNNTLKLMGRKYTNKRYKKEVNTIRQYMPNAAISTDIMVGFPQEDEVRFNESLEFVKDIGFAKIHVFPYSIRPGTAAAKFKGQLTNVIKQERASIMQNTANISRHEYLLSMMGHKVNVLLESADENGDASGYSGEYIRVKVCKSSNRLDQILEIILGKDNIVYD